MCCYYTDPLLILVKFKSPNLGQVPLVKRLIKQGSTPLYFLPKCVQNYDIRAIFILVSFTLSESMSDSSSSYKRKKVF